MIALLVLAAFVGLGAEGVEFRAAQPAPPTAQSTIAAPGGTSFFGLTPQFSISTRTASNTGLDVWVLPLSGDRQPFPFVETRAAEDNAAFSPDDRWIAYQSNESGRDEVYVRPFPPAGGGWLVSRTGGTQPRWRGDGRELFFLAPDGSVMAAAVDSTSRFEAAVPRRIVPAAMTLVIRHAYTVTRDGQRVLIPVIDQRNPSLITVDAVR